MKKIIWVIIAILITVFIAYVFSPKPDLHTFTSYSNVYLDRDDQLLRLTLAEDDRYRIYEKLDDISPYLVSASVLYEDQHYYSHSGVDYFALIRAFWTTYVMQQRRVGASTIAMQVARLRWSIPSNKLIGKFQQIIRAIQLTRHYSKKELLEAYLNMAPYGRNIEGIGAASLIYFNKRPSQLSLPEALTLAVIPQNPNKRNPTTEQGYKFLTIARSNLFKRWLEKYPEDKGKQKYFELALNVRSLDDLPFNAPHFINYLNKLKSRWDNGYIHTTLDRNLQNTMEHVIKSYVSRHNNKGINNASALLINYETMELKAMVGSADFYNQKIQGQVNGVIAKRSPGSTLKPFVYALAIDEGIIHPMTLMKDAQLHFSGFTPENYDKRFLGPVVAKDALILSRNLPAVTLQASLQKKSLYQFLKDSDVSNLSDESFYGMALVLGGAELTMMELVKLYALLANNGKLQNIKVKMNESSLPAKQLLSAEAAFLVMDMLKDNPKPDALNFNAILNNNNQVAWKTGTSWAFRDAWSVGVSGPYVLAVWVGNFDNKGSGTFIGRSSSGPLFFSLLDAISPSQSWTVDELKEGKQLNIKKVNVCKTTGDLLSKHCPVSEKSWFIPGVSPIKVSNIYRSIAIEKSSGLRACWYEPGKTEMKVFEFWPSDFIYIFKQAGISLKTPPKFSTQCSLDLQSSTGLNPIIRLPQHNLQYIIRSDDVSSQKIPFSAVVDSDVKKLYWFVNDQYVGSSVNGEAFIWHAISGEHDVKIVDDQGRAANIQMNVVNIH